ncbi:hypothetical protein BJ742DRAFT_816800 [Cladochytrium replicatum]|nr:hypothetical protein BJ742DRAFT_816800 [Cladochytrium replicatum]
MPSSPQYPASASELYVGSRSNTDLYNADTFFRHFQNQITVGPTSTVQTNWVPEERVDYFSFDFNPFDLHQCWRNATKHKDGITNGRRLENASWRKFFQMKFDLKTIDPGQLNWKKDDDVNWLYGPFRTYDPLPVLVEAATAQARADYEESLMRRELKPALKKSTRPDDFMSIMRELYIQSRERNNPALRASLISKLGGTLSVYIPPSNPTPLTGAAAAAVSPPAALKPNTNGAPNFNLVAGALRNKSASDLASLSGKRANFYMSSPNPVTGGAGTPVIDAGANSPPRTFDGPKFHSVRTATANFSATRRSQSFVGFGALSSEKYIRFNEPSIEPLRASPATASPDSKAAVDAGSAGLQLGVTIPVQEVNESQQRRSRFFMDEEDDSEADFDDESDIGQSSRRPSAIKFM